MAKVRVIVGYATPKETSPGVWEDKITKRTVRGELVRNMSNWQAGASANDDLKLNNQISIVADPYNQQNFSAIKYVELRGTRWKVSCVEVKYPRLLLTLGGVYNG